MSRKRESNIVFGLQIKGKLISEMRDLHIIRTSETE